MWMLKVEWPAYGDAEVAEVGGLRGLRADVKRNLRGKRLLCHCAKHDLPCHAEVLAALANEPLKAERALRENA